MYTIIVEFSFSITMNTERIRKKNPMVPFKIIHIQLGFFYSKSEGFQVDKLINVILTFVV